MPTCFTAYVIIIIIWCRFLEMWVDKEVCYINSCRNSIFYQILFPYSFKYFICLRRLGKKSSLRLSNWLSYLNRAENLADTRSAFISYLDINKTNITIYVIHGRLVLLLNPWLSFKFNYFYLSRYLLLAILLTYATMMQTCLEIKIWSIYLWNIHTKIIRGT